MDTTRLPRAEGEEVYELPLRNPGAEAGRESVGAEGLGAFSCFLCLKQLRTECPRRPQKSHKTVFVGEDSLSEEGAEDTRGGGGGSGEGSRGDTDDLRPILVEKPNRVSPGSNSKAEAIR